MPFDKRSIVVRDFWTCQTCHKRVDQDKIQIAHRIKQDKTQTGKGSVAHIAGWLRDNDYPDMSVTEIVAKIINHPFNVCVTCSSNCNDAQNIFFNQENRDGLLKKIMDDIKVQG